MSKSHGITVFTWDYWGWGSATPALVATAAAVEHPRGFGSPLLVDVRRMRDARAAGFQGDAFKKAAGRETYRWMPSSPVGSRVHLLTETSLRDVCANAKGGVPLARVMFGSTSWALIAWAWLAPRLAALPSRSAS